MSATYSYNTTEKLKSRKLLDQLFTKGRSVSAFPVKAFYMPLLSDAEVIVQAGVGVSARNFTKAVHRNRIKRLLRETYRLNKAILQEGLQADQKKAAVFFLYIGKEIPDFVTLNELMPSLLNKLAIAIAKA
ncbi:MAG: ribonuclease P protein component [Sediminibacterium sp.]|nr:ribonuclease P protein component [Sediminibacterium sp.]MDP1810697.1 ribonuclease P protein component [Sediminibacterium sp.]MDP3129354.1 ribonuclease P protein component [Sediminibacterium sp.]MDP3666485.1 ribonuclease P protein component [Sediminibacterium sp.]